jgi:hypothetical protein
MPRQSTAAWHKIVIQKATHDGLASEKIDTARYLTATRTRSINILFTTEN